MIFWFATNYIKYHCRDCFVICSKCCLHLSHGAIHSLFTIAFAIIFLPFLSLTEDDDHHHGIGFSLELIHRDSPSSPSYNPVGSYWQRLSNALQRSHHRVTNHFGRKGSGLRATSPIGSPFNLCCRRVFGEHIDWDTAQNFDRHCGHRQPSYVDAMQAVTAGKAAVSIPNTIFGCGHDNGGIFSGTETGIVGLGSGAVSLISQIGNVVSGRDVVSTPFLSNGSQTYYYLELQGISV
ncbi:hypothetical protein COP2_041402 [Malus domestica]